MAFSGAFDHQGQRKRESHRAPRESAGRAQITHPPACDNVPTALSNSKGRPRQIRVTPAPVPLSQVHGKTTPILHAQRLRPQAGGQASVAGAAVAHSAVERADRWPMRAGGPRPRTGIPMAASTTPQPDASNAKREEPPSVFVKRVPRLAQGLQGLPDDYFGAPDATNAAATRIQGRIPRDLNRIVNRRPTRREELRRQVEFQRPRYSRRKTFGQFRGSWLRSPRRNIRRIVARSGIESPDRTGYRNWWCLPVGKPPMQRTLGRCC